MDGIKWKEGYDGMDGFKGKKRSYRKKVNKWTDDLKNRHKSGNKL